MDINKHSVLLEKYKCKSLYRRDHYERRVLTGSAYRRNAFIYGTCNNPNHETSTSEIVVIN